ncbi:Alpha-galactosylglucosyldiacylglycerol synthase [Collinsella aerofaciens]|uniref:Alpha-galactosylglucosyldiacylglycerol synthase n=1 Tax=Collinsella aerofaciens TaxID=74426 RepID=A0A5K1IPF6_9ACTN|nr:glycosyltransferase family 4 protein [Collinsella aerofaciens]VWL90144.1 Alpha-galactosylglucosyldiacylglycerol synthase [Collinsella aerofaciens]
MRIFEIGTGYTSIPADKGAATEIVVDNLSRSLIKLGHDVTVVDIEDPNRLPTDLPILEVPMPKGFGATDEALGIKHKLKRVVYSIKLAGVLKRVLQQLPAGDKALLHFHNQYNAFFFYRLVPSSLRSKVAVAYTVHSYIWHDDWDVIEGMIKRRYFQEVDAMKRADQSFVLNDDAISLITEHVGIDASKLTLIANGVDTEAYRPCESSEVADLASSLGLADMDCIIQVGSVCDRKNQIGALKMVAPLMRERENLAYIYAGGVIDQEYKDSLDTFASSYGISERVVYLGELKPGKELNRYYNLAKCSLFATKAEAFSLVVIEAMSSGQPVFVDSALKVDLDGIERYNDGDELRRKISRILDDEPERERVAAAARATVLEKYSWDKVAFDYARAFEKLI